MAWGIFPLFFAAHGLGIAQIGLLKFVYPAVWSVLQIATGPLSDRVERKHLIALGMVVQAVAIFLTLAPGGMSIFLASTVLLGVGTALVYPTLIAVVSDAAEPAWRQLGPEACGSGDAVLPSSSSAGCRTDSRSDVVRRIR